MWVCVLVLVLSLSILLLSLLSLSLYLSLWLAQDKGGPSKGGSRNNLCVSWTIGYVYTHH